MALNRLPRVAAVALLAGLGACEDTTAPIPALGYIDVATGSQHSCALSTDGAAYCWGRGWNGELGIGTLLEGVTEPVGVDTSERFTSITAGAYHTCALATDGRAYCWGWNAWGQAGIDDPDAQFLKRPVPVAGDRVFTRLEAGWYHTCGITDQGEALCWGNNGDGQLGDGTRAHRRAPTPVAAAGPFVELAAGGFHSCATDSEGRAWCWGRNVHGQLGDATTERRSEPVAVGGGRAFVVLDGGGAHTCGVASAGGVYCWGSNGSGELGNRATGNPGLPGATAPVRVARDEPYTAVSAGDGYTCAVDAREVGYCWGAGAYGQLGTLVTETVNRPTVVNAARFRHIAASARTHTCGITPARHLYCWGTGEAGQLGDPTTTSTPVPLPVVNPASP